MGIGNVSPNPMVGAVLMYDDRIIGEGYHMEWGGAHAEVNCLNSVSTEDQFLISQSSMYVSLEPCAHHGKTPPCTDLIISKKIPKVIVGCRDPFPEVNGKGIEKLKAAGVEVELGILENQCRELNKRFFTFHQQHRPYIILKWAQTTDKKIGNENYSRLLISNEISDRQVHKWRSEEASILVGTNTALFDDPSLTTRLWPGKNPIRLVADIDLRLPTSLKVFDRQIKTIVFNSVKHEESENLVYYQVSKDTNLVHQLVHALYHLKVQSVLVEGGARMIQSFIDENLWDEARVITNTTLEVENGLPAPELQDLQTVESVSLGTDRIDTFKNATL
jgi:diaminohydroxyphosphoribosylaminopyrimidine deaminase/5-amino-6-(5-phosphoribosylamino)uracil reductase